MANNYGSSTSFGGLWPKEGRGGSLTPRARRYQVVTGYTTKIGKGSPVVLTTTGVKLLTRANTTDTGSTLILGVAQHAWSSGAGEGHDITIFDDPNQLFECSSDDNTTLALKIGLNFSFINLTDANQVNSTINRWSKQALDGSTGNTALGATTASRPLKLIQISRKIDKSVSGSTFTGCLVQINPFCHFLGKPGVGI